MIRDAALAASGLLVAKIGGPSVKPYQPEGVWEAVAMPESNTHFYRPDHGDRLYRRSLYTLLEAERTAGVARHLQRPHARDLHRPPRAHQHAAPGAGDAQRPTVRRGRPSARRARPQRGRQPATTRASTCSPAGCWRGRCSPEEQVRSSASLARLAQCYRSHPDEAARLIAVGESKADPALDRRRSPPGPCWRMS